MPRWGGGAHCWTEEEKKSELKYFHLFCPPALHIGMVDGTKKSRDTHIWKQRSARYIDLNFLSDLLKSDNFSPVCIYRTHCRLKVVWMPVKEWRFGSSSHFGWTMYVVGPTHISGLQNPNVFFYNDFLKGHMVTAVDQGRRRAFEEPLCLNNLYYGAHIQREAG